MDREKVAQIIADDLAANPDFYNSHGVDVKSCLVPPQKTPFEDSFRQGEFLELWLVLRENPDLEEGYLVVFDEQTREFGLAVYGQREPVFIGYYGSCTETLSGM